MCSDVLYHIWKILMGKASIPTPTTTKNVFRPNQVGCYRLNISISCYFQTGTRIWTLHVGLNYFHLDFHFRISKYDYKDYFQFLKKYQIWKNKSTLAKDIFRCYCSDTFFFNSYHIRKGSHNCVEFFGNEYGFESKRKKRITWLFGYGIDIFQCLFLGAVYAGLGHWTLLFLCVWVYSGDWKSQWILIIIVSTFLLSI